MKQSTTKKSILKQGYFYEEKPWYDSLPDKLPVPSYQEQIFPRDMSHEEILSTYKIEEYTVEEAFAVAADKSTTLKEGEYRLVYFMDGDIRYGLFVFRSSGGELGVRVYRVGPGCRWDAGYGVLFSNGNSDALPSLTLEPLDTLTDETAIAHLKSHGYKITRLEEKEY